MPLFQVRDRFGGGVRFEGEFGSLRQCVEAAVKAGVDCFNADFSDANLAGVNLSRANLAGVDLSGADLSRADLCGADLCGAILYGAYLYGAYLSGADLSGARFYGAHLFGANLAGADLAGAYFYGANLAGADLAGTDLSGAKVSGVDLSRANLAGAIWRETKLGRRGLVKYANRSDGYEFRLFACADGLFRVAAGCRWLTMEEAWQHWRHRAGTDLGSETDNILSMFERHIELMAKEPLR
jgi:hypothetical protein